jgi:putative ABC transport system permease protein
MPDAPFSLRLYRRLLTLYPATFRENYAGPLERQFRDELAESSGVARLGILWIRILADLAVSVPSQFAREVMQDARHALRLWARQPWHIGFVIVALAVGIGANTGIFGIVNALLLRSLPFRDPGRLVALEPFSTPHDSAKQFHDWRGKSTYLDDAAMLDSADVNLGGVGEAVRVRLSGTSSNFFSMLGTQPIIGRAFLPREDTPGRDHVTVIGYGLWQQLFGGDPKVLGSIIQANGTDFTIVGVAPSGFDYPGNAALWTPTAFDAGRLPKAWQTIARLKTAIGWSEARAAFAAEAERLAPNRRPADKIRYPARMIGLQDKLAGPVKNASLLLMAGVVLILLIACTNVANLLMARTADRSNEISIRSALGASRARLSQQLLTESLLLALVASAAGLLVAHSIASIATRVQPAPIAGQAYTILDARVLGFAIVISIVSGLLFGVLPSMYAGRVHTFAIRSETIKSGARTVREILIGAQIMFTIVLLASTVSIGRAFLHLMKADRGFDMPGIVTVNVSLAGTKDDVGERPLQYFKEAISRIKQVPGVRAASVTDFLPLNDTPLLGSPFWLDGRPAQRFSMVVPIMPDYFETMGGRMIEGREFSEAEMRGDAQVAVINETLANEFGGPVAVLGHDLRAGRQAPMKIIGIVKDMVYLGDYNPTQVFVPDPSPGRFFVTIVARVSGRAEDHLAAIRDAVKSVDPETPVFAVKTMEERLADALARPKFYSIAALFFASFALLLAVIGIYGAVSYNVSQRAHEMGVRMALGTTPGRLRGLLLLQSLVSIGAGAIPGIAIAVGGGRFLESFIEGAKSVSLNTCAISLVFVVAIATVGIWAGSRRVARLDIVEILRAQ